MKYIVVSMGKLGIFLPDLIILSKLLNFVGSGSDLEIAEGKPIVPS